MAQHDMIIDNATFAAFRADVNSAIQALVTNNNGPDEPEVTYPRMWWPDETSGWMKQRNAADTAWINVFPLGVELSPSLVGASILSVSPLVSISNTVGVSAIELVDPTGIIVAGLFDGYIHRSENFGATWTQIAQLGTETSIPCIKDVPFTNNVIAGTAPTGQIYRSTNLGASWALIGRLGAATKVCSLVVGTNVYLAGTDEGKVYRATNSGGPYNVVGQLGAETEISALVEAGGVFIAGTSPGGKIYRSVDAGQSWSLIGQLGTETKVSALWVANGVWYAGTYPTGQIYRSTDAGQTWTLAQRLGASQQVLSIRSIGVGKIVAVADASYYFSTDHGQTWKLSQYSSGSVLAVVRTDTELMAASAGAPAAFSRIRETFL